MTTYYKVTGPNGESIHGGSLAWTLPDGETPGAWHEVAGEVVVCENGLHLTSEPARWWQKDARVFEAEYEGDADDDGEDKIAVRRARLVREVTDLSAVRIFLSGRHMVTEGFCVAYGSATVEAYGSATVEASGSATVEASGSATVEASGSATVEAYGSATVTRSQYGHAGPVTLADRAVCIDRRAAVPACHVAPWSDAGGGA